MILGPTIDIINSAYYKAHANKDTADYIAAQYKANDPEWDYKVEPHGDKHIIVCYDADGKSLGVM